jgi:hypothetical protein
MKIILPQIFVLWGDVIAFSAKKNLLKKLILLMFLIISYNNVFCQKINNYIVKINPSTGKLDPSSNIEALYMANFNFGVVKFKIGDDSFNMKKAKLNSKVTKDDYYFSVSPKSLISYGYAIIDNKGNFKSDIFSHIDIWGNGIGLAYKIGKGNDNTSHQIYWVDLNEGTLLKINNLPKPNLIFMIGVNIVYIDGDILSDAFVKQPVKFIKEGILESRKFTLESKWDWGYTTDSNICLTNCKNGTTEVKRIHWIENPINSSPDTFWKSFKSMQNFENSFRPKHFIYPFYDTKNRLYYIFYNEMGKEINVLIKDMYKPYDFKFNKWILKDNNSKSKNYGKFLIADSEMNILKNGKFKDYYTNCTSHFLFKDSLFRNFVILNKDLEIATDSIALGVLAEYDEAIRQQQIADRKEIERMKPIWEMQAKQNEEKRKIDEDPNNIAKFVCGEYNHFSYTTWETINFYSKSYINISRIDNNNVKLVIVGNNKSKDKYSGRDKTYSLNNKFEMVVMLDLKNVDLIILKAKNITGNYNRKTGALVLNGTDESNTNFTIRTSNKK